MGLNYSVEDSEECTAQDDKPLVLFGKHFVADGKKIFVIHADKQKPSKSTEQARAWSVQDTHGKECFKVDYRFKYTQLLLDQKKNILATLDKEMNALMYTKYFYFGDSFDDDDRIVKVERILSLYKAEMHAKIYDKNKRSVLEVIKVLGNIKDKTFVIFRGDGIIAKTYRMDKFGDNKNNSSHGNQDTYYLEVASGVDTALAVSMAVAMNRFMRKS